MHEIAEFLARHPPFDTLDDDQLAEVAAVVEIEYAQAGTTVLEQAVEAPSFAWVIRRGAVELLDGARIVDMLGEGEMFGHAALLSEWPTVLAARTAEDSLLYRIPAQALRPVLARPAALRFAARSLSARFALRRGISRARTPAEVASAAAALPATVVALHDAKVAADAIGRVIATVHDAVTRRLIELSLERSPVETSFTWLVLGSVARREAFPNSDQDSAIAWHGDGDEPTAREPLAALADEVVEGGRRSGFPACPNGAVASKPLRRPGRSRRRSRQR